MHRKFWEECPALLFGLSLLIGSGSFLFWDWPWGCLWVGLWLGYLAWLRKWPLMALVIGGSIYGTLLYSGSPQGKEGYFSIASVQTHQTPFQKGILYKGMLYVDQHRLPCAISHTGKERVKGDSDYVVRGQLIQRGPYQWVFKAKEWKQVEGTWSLAEWRFQMKERFRLFLESKLKKPRVASFLSSLITGDVEDRMLRFEFGRLGLQHILAISGFHFAILIAFCSFFLGLFLPHRIKIIALLLAVNAYFVFIGSLPAVQRSWLMALLYLVGQLIYRHSTGLNLLGVALLVEIMLDPLVSGHLGFQLSFLSCTGILLFRPFFKDPLQWLLPRHRTEMLSPLSRHVYLIVSFLRECLSVNFAVNLAILPLLLYHFHQFPYLSLLYNLFFPLLVSLGLFLLLLSLLAYGLFAPLGTLLFRLTDLFTAQLLDLTAYPPIALDYSLKVASLPAWIIPPYLAALFCLSLLYQKSLEEKYV